MTLPVSAHFESKRAISILGSFFIFQSSFVPVSQLTPWLRHSGECPRRGANNRRLELLSVHPHQLQSTLAPLPKPPQFSRKNPVFDIWWSLAYSLVSGLRRLFRTLQLGHKPKTRDKPAFRPVNYPNGMQIQNSDTQKMPTNQLTERMHVLSGIAPPPVLGDFPSSATWYIHPNHLRKVSHPVHL